MTELEKESLGMVSVATPASYVANDGPFTTLTTDKVMNLVRKTFPLTLPANITNNKQKYDFLSHNFVKCYMGGDISRPKILSDVLDVFSSLVDPIPVVKDGVITLTLTWGNQPDLDLHVYEPEGSHIYYADRYGASGHLDYDDTDGKGPEHYYVDCDALQVGVYTLGVNYYRGSAPENGTIQIKAGTMIRSHTFSVTSQRGSSGNNSPMTLGHVVVEMSPSTGEYQFYIR